MHTSSEYIYELHNYAAIIQIYTCLTFDLHTSIIQVYSSARHDTGL